MLLLFFVGVVVLVVLMALVDLIVVVLFARSFFAFCTLSRGGTLGIVDVFFVFVVAYRYVCVIIQCAARARVQMCTLFVAISVEETIGGQNASRGKLDICFDRVVVIDCVFDLYV